MQGYDFKTAAWLAEEDHHKFLIYPSVDNTPPYGRQSIPSYD